MTKSNPEKDLVNNQKNSKKSHSKKDINFVMDLLFLILILNTNCKNSQEVVYMVLQHLEKIN